MSASCPECGAAIPSGGSCRDHFESLLAFEWTVPGGAGEVAHFHAVVAYMLQHPRSMNLAPGTFSTLRTALSDELDGHLGLTELRRRMHQMFDGPVRARRDPDDLEVDWPSRDWPVIVTDVTIVEADASGYADRVRQWAQAVRKVLDEHDRSTSVQHRRE